jgi:exopolysaccharide production protein ExoQ
VRGRHQGKPLGILVAEACAVRSAAPRWCEAGLGICAALLPPILALAPHGVAPLAAAAGLCAAGLVWATPPYRFAGLYHPAAILAALLLWGALSAAWAIDPQRSLALDLRLLGLFVAGLALAAAAGRIAAPQRLAQWLFAGIVVAIALAAYDYLSTGELIRLIAARGFRSSRLNQIAVGLTLLWLPASALLLRRHGVAAALGAAALMAGAVLGLEDFAAKTALAASLAAALLLYRWRRAATRLLAALCLIGILTAPLILPQLARAPWLFAAGDAFKHSFGHRLLIWSFVGERIAERPVAGWGLDAARAMPGGKDELRPGEMALPLHPHNAALQLWLELGVPGAALLALFTALLWRRIGSAPWPPLYAAAAGGSLAGALAAAFAAYGIWQEWWLGTLALTLFLVLVMARATALGRPFRS